MANQYTELLQDKAFMNEMLSQKSAEDVQQLYAAHGVEVTMEEVNYLGSEIAKIEELSQSSGELSEETMESVSGGIAFELALAIGSAVFAVGGAGLSIYKWWRSR